MKGSELSGKSVVSLAEARKLGVVHDVLVDPSYRVLQALKVKSSAQGPDYLVRMDKIRGVGRDAITVTGQDALVVPEQDPTLSQMPSLSALQNSQVVSESGESLGNVFDFEFDPQTRQIQRFYYRAGGLAAVFGRPNSVAVSDVVGFGPGMITVSRPGQPTAPGGPGQQPPAS